MQVISTTLLIITDVDLVRVIVRENSIDAADDNYELTGLLDKIDPEDLALVMKEMDVLLVSFSTDFVFGKEPYIFMDVLFLSFPCIGRLANGGV